MNKNYVILIILLLTSVTYNFYLASQSNYLIGPCDNQDRYDDHETEGAIGIKKDEAKDLVLKYRNDFPPEQNNERPTGYVFTKRMFDKIFMHDQINSVTLDLVTYHDKVSLVVREYKTLQTKLGGDESDNIYVIQSFCTDQCSVW